MVPINHWEASLKREFTRIYKNMFGKGPENTTVKIFEDMILFKIEGALTPIEQNLILTDGGPAIVHEIRDRMVLDKKSEYTSVVESLINEKVDNVCYTFDENGHAMYMFMVLHNSIEKNYA